MTDNLRSTNMTMAATIARLTAERDALQARLAGAFEEAARVAESQKIGPNTTLYGDCHNGGIVKVAAAIRALAPAQAGVGGAASDVIAERERQKSVEGWTAEHDDRHDNGEIAAAAAAYSFHVALATKLSADGTISLNRATYLATEPPAAWPWIRYWWKPASPRRDLVKAGALILAEIERLDRADQNGSKS